MCGTDRVYERAVGLLALRDHGRTELARKLRGKGCPPDEVEDALRRLEASGYVNDAAVVEREVDRLVREGRGPLIVRQKLGQRGFEGTLVEAAIGRVDEDGRFTEGCREALRRRFGAVDTADRKAWLKAARFLAGRGFPESLVRATLRE